MMVSSTTWTLTRFMLVAILYIGYCDALTKHKCYQNINNTKHKPLDEIDLLVGDDFSVDCIDSNLNGSDGDLFWKYDNSVVESVVEINSTALRLNMNNVSSSQTGYYKCLKGNNSNGVCIIKIKIGYKPLPIVDFLCTSYNTEYMICSWTAPPNNIKVNYTLNRVYNPENRIIPTISPCLPVQRNPKLKGVYFYNFTSNSGCQYDKYRNTQYFELIGKNKFDTAIWNFTVDHFKRVIPGPVENINTAFSSTTVNITYSRTREMRLFIPGLTYKVYLSSPWGKLESSAVVNDTWMFINNLQPYTNYSGNVTSLASSANPADELMWSKPSPFYFQTLPAAPEAVAEIVPGSFKIQTFLNHSDITLYWKAVSDKFKNGKNFIYKVIAKSLTNIEEAKVLTTDKGFITFTNLSCSESYSFNLFSQNDIGTSNSSSIITIGSTTTLLSKPKSITVTQYSEVVHNIKWLPPTNSSYVTGYRIFWTESDTRFQTNPKGYLFWKDVDKSVTKANITIEGRWPHHTFGVSAISKESASGIIWNTCIVLFNGTIGQMKFVEVSANSSTSLIVKWNIDCAEKLGVVIGFNIYYCAVDKDYSVSCDDKCRSKGKCDELKGDDNAVSHEIKKLNPNSWYKVTVSAVTLAGEGEQSRPILVRTLESVPEYAASDVEVREITNTSFVVKWHPPNVTNGIIIRYEIYYSTLTETEKVIWKTVTVNDSISTFIYNVTENVTPYTNYSVTIKACTKVGCSLPSLPKIILTDIGTPAQMEPPEVRLLNTSIALVERRLNSVNNGPLYAWDIKTVIVKPDNTTIEQFYTNLTEELIYMPVKCDDLEFKDSKIEVQTRAVNVKESEFLIGDWSDYAKINCFIPVFPIASVVGIVVGTVSGIVVFLFILMYSTKRVKLIIYNVNHIKIELPGELKGGEQFNGIVSGNKPFARNNVYTKADLGNDINRKLLDDDSRSRNISGDTTQSGGSTEELLLHHKKLNWGNESIGSVNNDSTSSRPSTTQTQLSSESSLEQVPSVPESPDSVFNDHPLKAACVPTVAQTVENGINSMTNSSSNNAFNPTLTPIGETGDQSQSGTPQHYSKFAGYYGPANGALSPKRGGVGGSRVIQNGYVAAPYSKFGLGTIGGSPNHGGDLIRTDSPSDRYSMEISDEPPQMSYSKVGLSIPLFDDQHQTPNSFHKTLSATSSPLTSTPTHAVAGYSVLGLGQVNPIYDLGNSQPFSQPPPVAVSSPIEGSSKGYVLAAAMNNPMIHQQTASPAKSTHEEFSSSSQNDGVHSPNYTSMNAHKRSPSNASSLTAGYCRLALSRPNSMCSETDQNYVRADSQSGNSGVLGSPVASSCHNSAIDIVSNNLSNAMNSGSPTSTTMVGGLTPSGYATVQQLLKEKGNS